MDTVSILDNGSQYTHLIATKIRNKLNVYSEIVPSDVKASKLENSKAIILSGSPFSVHDDNAPDISDEVFELGVPILGLCYGLQLMSHKLGGEVKLGKVKEYGSATLNVERSDSVLKGLSSQEQVWMSHGDSVKKLPDGFVKLGSTSDCPFAAVANFDKNFFGLQFHPEVDNTLRGVDILGNFVLNIAGCKPDWNISDFIESETLRLRSVIGKRKVLLLVSGGVDSTVCAALLERALGSSNVIALHIDNGLMREKESKFVASALRGAGFKNINVVDASDDFLSVLEGKIDPEEKRMLIGKEFIKVSNKEVDRLGLKDWLLGQGTIYPDTIESGGSKHAAVIKTHHNRVPIIEQMIADGKIIEPIKELYKEEVRDLGRLLGLHDTLVKRHPFPGPGLGIRVLCSDGNFDDLDHLTKACNSISEDFGYRSFVLPVKSVGVKGDSRSYEHPVALEGLCDWKSLAEVSTSLTNEVKGINRVVFTLQPGVVESVSLSKGFVSRDRVELLRKADKVVSDSMNAFRLVDKVWQFPVVLAPLSVNGGGGESVILRPVYSKRAMTAKFADLPWGFVNSVAAKVLGKGIDAVFYDITNKPPGTIEWE